MTAANEVRCAAQVHGSVQKHTTGRPTKYKPEYCEMILCYFRIDLEREVEVTRVGKDGTTETVIETVVSRFPTLDRFAASIGADRKTVHAWATAMNRDGSTFRYPEFASSYQRAKDLQAALLIEGGMGKVYDARFAALAAKNLLGWRDHIEQTVMATVTQAAVDELNAIYQRGIEKSIRGRLKGDPR